MGNRLREWDSLFIEPKRHAANRVDLDQRCKNCSPSRRVNAGGNQDRRNSYLAFDPFHICSSDFNVGRMQNLLPKVAAANAGEAIPPHDEVFPEFFEGLAPKA